MLDQSFEPCALFKHPVTGKCGGRDYHRLGLIPVRSLLDGGLPGDSCQGYCLDCGKKLRKTAFVVIKQPNSLKVTV